MIVSRINKDHAICDLKEYVKRLESGKIEERTFRRMKYMVSIINHDIDDKLTLIECGFDEINTLLHEYLSLISRKHHLLVCAFIGNNASIETVPMMRAICSVSEFYEILPAISEDDQVRIYIYYYSSSNKKAQMYDIDYSVKMFFNS